MGSLIMPSDRAALYTIKPTAKLILQDGIIPVSKEADSARPMTKSVQDLADRDMLVDPSQTTVPEDGYRSAVTGSWGDIRIGVLEPAKWLFPHKIEKFEKEATDQVVSISSPRKHLTKAHHLLQLREWKAANERPKGLVKVANLPWYL